MRVVTLRQRTPDWHRWRAAGLTATDAPKLAGYWEGPGAVYAAKTGDIAPEPLTANMIRGTELEPIARRECERDMGTIFEPVCAEYDAWPIARASFDGVSPDGHVLEIKCPNRSLHDKGTLPLYYRPQLMHQALVAGVSQVFYASYCPEAKPQLRITLIAFDELEIGDHLARCQRFWVDHVVPKIPPPAGEEPRQLREDAAWVLAAEEYRRWTVACDELQAKRDAARALLEEMAGDADRVGGGGVLLTRSIRQGLIDYKAALDSIMPAGFDVERWRKKSGQQVRITVEE